MFTRRHLNSLFWISIIIAIFFPFFSIIATLLLLPSFVIRLYFVYWLISLKNSSFFSLTFLSLSLNPPISLCFSLLVPFHLLFLYVFFLLSVTPSFLLLSFLSVSLWFFPPLSSLLYHLPLQFFEFLTFLWFAVVVAISCNFNRHIKPQPKLVFGKYFLVPSPFCRLKSLFWNVNEKQRESKPDLFNFR